MAAEAAKQEEVIATRLAYQEKTVKRDISKMDEVGFGLSEAGGGGEMLGERERLTAFFFSFPGQGSAGAAPGDGSGRITRPESGCGLALGQQQPCGD